MKEAFYKITSLILASLILFSTLSFTVEKHYCGRFLVDVAVFSHAKDCGMNIVNSSDALETEMKKMSCCKDEVIVFEGQDELKFSIDQIDFFPQLFVDLFYYSYATSFSIPEKRDIEFKEYAPPERVCDIITLYETFLI